MAVPDAYVFATAAFTGVTWDGTNGADVALFTDKRSTVKSYRDGVPAVIQIDVSPGVVLAVHNGDTIIKDANGVLSVVTPAQLAALYAAP